MTDIVERLRDHDRHIRGRLIEGLTDLVIDDMLESADEIERLREALREITTPAYEYLSGEAAARHKIEVARAALEEKE